MSANFTQVSGPGGRTQTLVPGAATQTFLWNPSSLKGQLDGGDFIYAKRIKFRTTGLMTNTAGTVGSLNWQQMAQAFGQVRVYSQFLGELVPKNLNSVPLIVNHDAYFTNGFQPYTRKRPQSLVTTGVVVPIEFVFSIDFERDYMIRPADTMPWLPFLEGGQIEVDLAPAAAFGGANGWTSTGNWIQSCVIDWYTDKQALIPAPIQQRLYKVTSPGPEYNLRAVGSPNGMDGVSSGSRLVILSMLMKGKTATIPNFSDNGYYAAFGGGGPTGLGTNNLTRLELPFRNQVGVDDVNSWFESFISDAGPTRFKSNINVETAANDMADWPNVMDPTLATSQSFISDQADFLPLLWPGRGDKISDFQKVNGDLQVQATWGTPPANVLTLFRTDEICGYTPQKIYDIMERMGLRHVDQGGGFAVVPKYAGAKKADVTTVWGFPLKIIKAK